MFILDAYFFLEFLEFEFWLLVFMIFYIFWFFEFLQPIIDGGKRWLPELDTKEDDWTFVIVVSFNYSFNVLLLLSLILVIL